MTRLTNIQLFCILVITMVPTPYQVLAKLLAVTVAHHGWLAILGSILPGFILVWAYYYILVNSSRPFPGLLEEHCGTVTGKILGFIIFGLPGSGEEPVIFANFFLSNVTRHASAFS